MYAKIMAVVLDGQRHILRFGKLLVVEPTELVHAAQDIHLP